MDSAVSWVLGFNSLKSTPLLRDSEVIVSADRSPVVLDLAACPVYLPLLVRAMLDRVTQRVHPTSHPQPLG